jgi:hypothetical protein
MQKSGEKKDSNITGLRASSAKKNMMSPGQTGTVELQESRTA